MKSLFFGLVLSLLVNPVLADEFFNEKEADTYRKKVSSACVSIKKSTPNKEGICKCIAKLHVQQAEHKITKENAIGQLSWVLKYYRGEFPPESLMNEPSLDIYNIWGPSRLVWVIDEECSTNSGLDSLNF